MKKTEFVVDEISIFPTDKENNNKEKMTLSSLILSEIECRQILKEFRRLNKRGRGVSRLEYLLNYYYSEKKLEFVSIQGNSGYSLNEVIGSDWDMDYSLIHLTAKSLLTWSGLFIFRKNQN